MLLHWLSAFLFLGKMRIRVMLSVIETCGQAFTRMLRLRSA
jgi:hypothetical protein